MISNSKVISKDNLCKSIGVIIFIALLIGAVFFSKGPFEQFISKRSSFAQSTGPIEKRPTIIICLDHKTILGTYHLLLWWNPSFFI